MTTVNNDGGLKFKIAVIVKSKLVLCLITFYI